MAAYKKIHYGYYEISKTGLIRRVKPGIGTWPGRKISPYKPGIGGTVDYVSLYRKGIRSQFKLDDLIRRVWR